MHRFDFYNLTSYTPPLIALCALVAKLTGLYTDPLYLSLSVALPLIACQFASSLAPGLREQGDTGHNDWRMGLCVALTFYLLILMLIDVSFGNSFSMAVVVLALAMLALVMLGALWLFTLWARESFQPVTPVTDTPVY